MTKKLTLQKIFERAIEIGIKNDPRGEKNVEGYLKDLNVYFENLSSEERKYFNEEFLTNPYHDSTIYFGKKNTEIKKIIVGIDVEGPEILLVHEYNKKAKKPIDLIIGHHPEARALLGIAPLQKSIAPFVAYNTGVPINICEKIEFPRVEEVEQRFSPMNHNRAIPFSEMLDIPYIGIHTPADNCVHRYFENLINTHQNSLVYLEDIIHLLMKEPEMQYAAKNGSGPAIWNGEKKSRCGKIVVTGITGGTESSKEIYAEYAKAGVGTVLEMHLSADHLREAKKHNINVIMTDHMASDSLGLNLILDEFKEDFEIMEFSGFTRFSRK